MTIARARGPWVRSRRQKRRKEGTKRPTVRRLERTARFKKGAGCELDRSWTGAGRELDVSWKVAGRDRKVNWKGGVHGGELGSLGSPWRCPCVARTLTSSRQSETPKFFSSLS